MPVPSHVLIDSLSGPDKVPAKAPATASPAVMVTPSPTRSAGGATPASSGVGSSSVGLGAVSAVSAVSTHSGGRTTSGSSVGSGTGVGLTTVAAGIMCSVHDPDYYFCGSMSEEVLHRYLDKVIDMQFLSRLPYDQRAEASPSFVPSDLTTYHYLSDIAYQHGQLLQMVISTKAKMVRQMIGFYGAPQTFENDFQLTLNVLTYDINYLKSNDPDIICGVDICEVIDIHDVGRSYFLLPTSDALFADVVSAFYTPDLYPTGRPSSYGPPFNFTIMWVNTTSVIFGTDAGHIDIVHPETRMWFYYLATQYIDCGCESIDFGDFGYVGAPYDCVCKNDLGLQHLWCLYMRRLGLMPQ